MGSFTLRVRARQPGLFAAGVPSGFVATSSLLLDFGLSQNLLVVLRADQMLSLRASPRNAPVAGAVRFLCGTHVSVEHSLAGCPVCASLALALLPVTAIAVDLLNARPGAGRLSTGWTPWLERTLTDAETADILPVAILALEEKQ